VSNGREHHTDGGKSNGGQSHLFVSALQEIGRRCGSKVEFRTVISTNKELQFSVEVSWISLLKHLCLLLALLIFVFNRCC
jgi:hypothetical protein